MKKKKSSSFRYPGMEVGIQVTFLKISAFYIFFQVAIIF